jgi:hypothetical protein
VLEQVQHECFKSHVELMYNLIITQIKFLGNTSPSLGCCKPYSGSLLCWRKVLQVPLITLLITPTVELGHEVCNGESKVDGEADHILDVAFELVHVLICGVGI